MKGVERSELEREETIKRIEAFVASSPCLEFTKSCYVQPRNVYVDVVSFKSATKVISELSELVKISEVDGAFFSKVTVKKSGSSVTKFIVSYHKKVLFLKSSGERITKDIATYLINDWK